MSFVIILTEIPFILDNWTINVRNMYSYLVINNNL